MKSTQEEKAAFMALYWGQEVGILKWRQGHITEPIVVVGEYDNFSDPIDHLLLKSLANISDEDAIEIGYDTAEEFNNVNRLHILYQDQCDYLRSKGYLLPFRQYSVEQILEMKWAEHQN